MQVIVGELLTTYERQGSGDVVLLLHGWGDSATGWRGFIAALSKSYDVVAPNLPGFGGTQAPPVAWGVDDYASFIRQFVEKLGIRPAIVIGHSNGGAIAIRALARQKIVCNKLVLLASAGIRSEYKGRNKVLRMVTKTGKVLTMPLPASAKRKLRGKVYSAVGSDMLVAEHMQPTFKRIVEDDVQSDAAELQLPTLIIYGEEDTQTPVRYGEQFHQLIDGSTLEVLPGTDHFLHLAEQTRILKLIREFVA